MLVIQNVNTFTASLTRRQFNDRSAKRLGRSFNKRACFTILDYLMEYNMADVEPFNEAAAKTSVLWLWYFEECSNYFQVNLRDMCRTRRWKIGPNAIFLHWKNHANTSAIKLYRKIPSKIVKKSIENVKNAKKQAYELFQIGSVGGPAFVFTKHLERGKTRIRAHLYGRNNRKCEAILGYDASYSCLYCSCLVLSCKYF